MMPPTWSFFSRNVLIILVPFPFHIKFTINLFIFIKNPAAILIVITLNLYRSTWGELKSLLCWFFQSMNVIYMPFYLGFWFILSIFCNFQHLKSVDAVLDLYLSLYFLMLVLIFKNLGYHCILETQFLFWLCILWRWESTDFWHFLPDLSLSIHIFKLLVNGIVLINFNFQLFIDNM